MLPLYAPWGKHRRDRGGMPGTRRIVRQASSYLMPDDAVAGLLQQRRGGGRHLIPALTLRSWSVCYPAAWRRLPLHLIHGPALEVCIRPKLLFTGMLLLGCGKRVRRGRAERLMGA